MIRTHMRNYFPKMIDALFVVFMTVVFIAAIWFGQISQYAYGYFFMPFAVMLLFGWVSTLSIFGVIYILLDIRDAVEKNASDKKA